MLEGHCHCVHAGSGGGAAQPAGQAAGELHEERGAAGEGAGRSQGGCPPGTPSNQTAAAGVTAAAWECQKQSFRGKAYIDAH